MCMYLKMSGAKTDKIDKNFECYDKYNMFNKDNIVQFLFRKPKHVPLNLTLHENFGYTDTLKKTEVFLICFKKEDNITPKQGTLMRNLLKTIRQRVNEKKKTSVISFFA